MTGDDFGSVFDTGAAPVFGASLASPAPAPQERLNEAPPPAPAAPAQPAAPIAEGLSPNYNRTVAQIESSGGASYGNGGGAYQFIPSTAKTLGYTQEQIRAMTPEQQDALNTKFTAGNTAALTKAGVPVNDFTAYVAHQQGGGGAAKLLTADPKASAVSVVGVDNANGNKSFFYNKDGSPKTVGDTLDAFRTRVATAAKAAGGNPDAIMSASSGAGAAKPKTVGEKIKGWLAAQSTGDVADVAPPGAPAKLGTAPAKPAEEPNDPSGGTMTAEQQAAHGIAAAPGTVSGVVRKGGQVYFQRYGKLFDAHGNLVG